MTSYSTMSGSMRGVLFDRYGSPDVLELREIPLPVMGPGEVLVRVRAVSINEWDWSAMHGRPFVNRMIFGLTRPNKQILGSDIAGRVEAVGSGVTKFRVGDEVFGDLSGRWGGFAEYVTAPETMLARKSPQMTFEQAAAIPQAAMLAVQALLDTARVQSGQSVLINGAGGGVGTFAIQLAKLHGAEVTAVDRLSKHETMRMLGADHVIDFAHEDFTKNVERYDVILDVKTIRPLSAMLRALRPGGMFVTVGGEMTQLASAVVTGVWMQALKRKRVRIVMLKTNKDLELMNELFESGKVSPVLDGSYELGRLPDAMRYYESGQHKGKVVITVR